MKKLLKHLVIGFSAVTLSGPLAAQDANWEYEATVYLFGAETITSIASPRGTLEGTLSFSDALSNLNFAFMGAFGASNGKWSVLADYMYTDLTFSNSTPGPAFNGIDTDMTTQFAHAIVGYRAHDTSTVQVDLTGGLRWFSADTAITRNPGTAPGGTNAVNDSWIDPVVGIKARFQLSDRWASTALVDYGGFSSDSESWQALVTADYALNDNWVLRGGYRYISVNHVSDGNRFKLSQSGVVFGATYKF